MKKKKNKFFAALIALAVCALMCVSAFAALNYALSPVSDESQVTVQFEVEPGMSAKSAAKKLKDAALIKSELLFYAAARRNNSVLKAGTYSVSPAMGLKDILSLLESGKTAYIVVSVPEGFTVNKIAALLEQNGVCDSRDFIERARDKDLLGEYDIPGDSFQGYLFPDTYFFLSGMESARVIRTMADTFFGRLNTIDGTSRLSALQLYDAVTLASIVEREYQDASEAPLIASVFSNRIKQNWGLYSCATIEFIITEIQGKPHPDVITGEDTRIDNPYNTYKWRGLPPGPIASPGLIALNAALNPADTDYYYFRLTGAGRHHFSENFTEHIEIGRQVTKKAAGS